MNFYQTWIDSGYHADMQYLKEHLSNKANPQKLLARAKTALVFAQPYHPFPEKEKSRPALALRSALYSKGRDYHHWFKKDLQRIAQELKLRFPDFNFLAMTDSSPVMERDLGAKAGLGWFGKNSCLLDRKHGSLFFLGEIYSDFEIQDFASATTFAPINFCGKCTKCMDICPTQALIQPKVLDANKCISYWTIESRKIAPPDIREKIGDWFFGCDLCQTICPWNQKVLNSNPLVESSKSDVIKDLRFILTASNSKLREYFRESALSRAGPFGLRRNAIIVAVNLRITELKNPISDLKKYANLKGLCEWAEKSLLESNEGN